MADFSNQPTFTETVSVSMMDASRNSVRRKCTIDLPPFPFVCYIVLSKDMIQSFFVRSRASVHYLS